MMFAEIPWSQLKAFVQTKGLYLTYYDYNSTYWLYAFDGPLGFSSRVYKDDGADCADFEANFKNASTTNLPLHQLDVDGAAIFRNKAAKKGWSYSVIPIEFETSRRSNYLYAKTVDDSDRSYVSLKVYDALDAEVTTDGAANANWANIVKTVIDFEPSFDYEIIGGHIKSLATITDNVRLWIIAVPDIAAGSGGSKEMVGGLNMAFDQKYAVDGRASKFMTYNATYHTNKLRFVLKYPAGVNWKLSINIELYKQ